MIPSGRWGENVGGSEQLVAHDIRSVLVGDEVPYDDFQVSRMPGSSEIYVETLNGDLYKITVEKQTN